MLAPTQLAIPFEKRIEIFSTFLFVPGNKKKGGERKNAP
jgi:hypothetical protein